MTIDTAVSPFRRIIQLALLAVLVAGCEGPVGPQGDTGPEGPAGPAPMPLFAVVDNAHTEVVRGNGVTTFDEGAPDNARVDITFDRPLTECAWVVSIGDVGLDHPGAPAGGARVEELVDDTTLRVVTFDVTGAATEYPFHLVVFC